jgi:hypothetical protein
MIELTTDDRLLARFVTQLDETSPRSLPAAPDLTCYAHEDREAARIAWATRVYDEYRSVAIFAELLALLTDVEAPFAALCAVQRLIGDELRHTQVTATVVEWLGGHADLEIDLRAPGLPPRSNEPAAERARKIIAREIVVAEEESIYALAAYRAATTAPAIRAVFDLLLVDEVRHAATGRALLRLVGTDDDLEAIANADRAELRARYADSARGGAGRALGACIEVADLEQVWARVP